MDTPQSVTDARSNAAKLGATAADYASAAYTIPDQLKKTVQEALDYNKDIVGMRSKALADYQASPAQANTKFGVQQFSAGPQAGQTNPDFIFNPFERNSTIQNYISNQSIPFSIANTLLGMREGTSADIINAGTHAFNSQATAAQAAANAARQTYEDVLNEYKTTTELNQAQQKINQSGTANGFDPLLDAWLKQQMGGGQGTPGLNQPGGPIGPVGPSPYDAAVIPDTPGANDPLFASIVAANKKKVAETQIPDAIQNLKVNLAPILQKSGTLSLSGNPSYNFRNANLQGLNLSGTVQ